MRSDSIATAGASTERQIGLPSLHLLGCLPRPVRPGKVLACLTVTVRIKRIIRVGESIVCAAL